MKNLLPLWLLLLGCLVAFPPQAFGRKDEGRKAKIVFIAGPNDHGRGTSPAHRYIEDMTLLKDAMEQADSGLSFDITLYIGERPPLGSLDDVDAVIVHSSGNNNPKEWHAIFPAEPAPGEDYSEEHWIWLRDFDRQIARGMGLMILHHSTWANGPEATSRLYEWIGGYFDKFSSKVKGDFSKTGTTAIQTTILASKHPALNGVKPWTLLSEMYHNMKIDDQSPRFTPLLQSMLPLNDPVLHTVAWAVERKDGGRGIGFTGGHNHENFYHEDFRKFVINSILWVSGLEVPRDGFKSKVDKRYWHAKN